MNKAKTPRPRKASRTKRSGRSYRKLRRTEPAKALVKRKKRRRKVTVAASVKPPAVNPTPPRPDLKLGGVPIIFIHRGDDAYLSYSLQQAKRANPHSPVFLLGDSANRRFASDMVQHFMIKDYFDSATKFAEVYRHQTPNAYDYELFCFQRWFVLKDFMHVNGIARTCYLDSDMMLYAEINNPLYHTFTNAWMMLSFNTNKTMEDFCYLVYMYFKNEDLFQYLQAYTINRGHAGISDMVFADLFLDHCPQYSLHRNGVFPDGFFDGNISHPMNLGGGTLEMLDGKRKVYRIHGALYARSESGRMVRIHALHFQGESKNYLTYFLAPDVHAASEVIVYFDYNSLQWLPYNAQ